MIMDVVVILPVVAVDARKAVANGITVDTSPSTFALQQDDDLFKLLHGYVISLVANNVL